MNLWAVFLTAVLLSGVLSVLLIPAAQKIGLIDRPCERKRHDGSVPLVGGLSVFITSLITFIYFFNLTPPLVLFLIASALMVAIGVLDDRFDLSVSLRILAQLLVSAIIVFGSDIYIVNLGDVLGLGEIYLGGWGIPFTLLAIMAAINAYNMIDGIDGLLGAMGLVSFAGLAVLAGMHGHEFVLAAAILVSGALLPFWCRNTGMPFPRVQKIFMGDAGSMFIGLGVIWMVALLVNPTAIGNEVKSVRPVAVLWFIAIPLMDMLAIMVRRIMKKQPPFRPDRDHLHHIFMRAGFSQREALFCITLKALLLATIGLIFEYFTISETIVMISFVLVFLAYCLIIKHAWKLVTWVRTMRNID